MTEDILEKANATLEDPDPTCGWTGTMIDLIAEVERLRSVISEPVKSFGTMELVSWVNQLQKTISEYPDAEWGNWPFVLMMGVHCENFSKRWHSPTIELMAARIKELEAEVEAKNKQIRQDIIDKPTEEADWVADYHLLQSALDGPIIDAARKWHAAYRKAQNSNLMRAKEVERLRSDWRQEHATAETWKEDFNKMQKRLTDSELLRQAQYNQTAAKDARIKELGSEVERLRSENKIISDRAAHHDRQDAAEIELLAARIKELEAGKLMYEEIAESYQIGVDDLRAYIKRLEAAFLGATKEIVYAIHEGRDAPEGEDVYAEKEAREALEEIKNGND